MNNHQIVWEKWENIYEDESEYYDEEYLEEEDDDFYTEEETRDNQTIFILNNNHSDNDNLSKIFNFWVCHCNFNIDQKCVEIIESCKGVETLEILTRYRFRISVGKIFNDGDVMRDINNQLLDYINNEKK